MILDDLRMPPPLQPGDHIGVVAPAGIVDASALAAGLAWLQAAGWVPVLGAAVLGPAHYDLAASDAQRLHDVQRFCSDHRIKALWAARGGYGCARLLPEIRNLKPSHAKHLIGFSDITALHVWWHRLGWMSVHAANVQTLPSWSEASRQCLWAMLRGHQQVGLQVSLPQPGAPPLGGRLWGGNLTILASLCGSDWLPDLTGGLLFLEDIGEPPYRLDRCLQQLWQAGFLAGIKAVVLGELIDRQGKPVDTSWLQSELQAMGIPCIDGLPCGHSKASWPLWNGGWVQLQSHSPHAHLRLGDVRW